VPQLKKKSLVTAGIKNKCSDEKIEIKDKVGNCKCEGGGMCIWNENDSIMGCPCTKEPATKPTCLRNAIKNGCSHKNIECSAIMGKCDCPDKS